MRNRSQVIFLAYRHPSPKCVGKYCLAAFAVMVLAILLAPHSFAQIPGTADGQADPARQGFPAMPNVRGTVISVQGSDVAIRTEQGGSYTVHCSENTRIYNNRQPVKVKDIHAGDTLIAAGELDDKAHTLRAVFVADIDAATVAKMRADLGKTWIAGKVTNIDMDTLKLTVQRMDQKIQVIAVDDTTSFKKDGQSVTLRDLKVGDTVRGKGGMKDNIFVPTLLDIVDATRMGRRRAQQVP